MFNDWMASCNLNLEKERKVREDQMKYIIIEEGKHRTVFVVFVAMPDSLRDITITPILDNKGYYVNCGNHRGRKQISHVMKLRERIIDQRLRDNVSISGDVYTATRIHSCEPGYSALPNPQDSCNILLQIIKL